LTKKSSGRQSPIRPLPLSLADSISTGAANVAGDFSAYLRRLADQGPVEQGTGRTADAADHPATDQYLALALGLLDQLPNAVKRLAAWRHLHEHAAVDQQLAFVLRCSDFIALSVRQQPHLLEELIRSDLCTSRAASDYRVQGENLLADVLSIADGDQEADTSSEMRFSQEIRNWRRTEMCRIAWRDLVGLATTSDTLRELSDLADVAVQLAEEFSWQQCVEKWGKPARARNTRKQAQADPRLVTLAMGKLGGAELNFSSDIDLIFVYGEVAETAGEDRGKDTQGSRKESTLSAEEFFHKQVQLIVRLLSKTTADGFVYRVDLRLRPFGSSGPLALGMDAFRHYYLTQGREWERYAMVKARAITGAALDREALIEILQPFIYRRYPDYTVFESLRDLKSKIASQLESAKQSDNIKTGPGGIREIEFIGQAFQLLRGGRDSSLQQRGIVPILLLLAERGLLTGADAEILLRAYDYLRRLENRLQMLRDEQTHAIPGVAAQRSTQKRRTVQWNGPAKRNRTSGRAPATDNDLDRIAAAMLVQHPEDMLATVKQHREQVHHIFNDLFRVDAGHQDIAQIPSMDSEIDFEDLLVQAGISNSASIAEDIRGFIQGPSFKSLNEASQRRVCSVLVLLPELSVRASGTVSTGAKRQARRSAAQTAPSVDAAETMRRLLAMVRRVAGRSGYLQILMERPEALELLGRLVARSAWMTDYILAHPIVIDALLEQQQLPRQSPESEKLPTRDDIGSESRRLYTQILDDDLDVQMDALRHFKLALTMKTVVAWLLESASVEQFSNMLTWTGESSLQLAANLVEKDLQRRHGRAHKRIAHEKAENPKVGKKVEAEFAIVGYGKLGSMELGLGSDLDIIFLHDSQDDDIQTDGAEPLDSDYYFSRLARKIVHFVTTLTPAGALYQIDTRLRPNGRAGMLVSSLDAFESYQSKKAWIWEHQALVRARVVVGSDGFAERFEQVRKSVLAVERDHQEVAEAVSAMRTRMRDHHHSKGNSSFDYKHGRGAIIDVEFIVQFLVLTASYKHPQLLIPRDNIQLLELIAKLGLLDKKAAQTLRDAYLYWRARALEQVLLSGASASTVGGSSADSPTASIADPEISQQERELSESVTEIWNSLLPASAPSRQQS